MKLFIRWTKVIKLFNSRVGHEGLKCLSCAQNTCIGGHCVSRPSSFDIMPNERLHVLIKCTEVLGHKGD